jgi:hypothetical protein
VERTPGVFLTIYNSRCCAAPHQKKTNPIGLQQVLPDFSHFRVFLTPAALSDQTQIIILIRGAMDHFVYTYTDGVPLGVARIHPDRYAGGEFK